VPAIPTKLYEACEKIRLGKVEEGTRLFDRIDGFDPIKAVPLSELSYFRHDWKRGMLFAQDFFTANVRLESAHHHYPSYVEQHIQMFLLATCLLDCWKDSRTFLNELKKQQDAISDPKEKYNVFYIKQAISMVADPINTTHRLKESKPKRRTEPLLHEWEKELDLSEFESRLYPREKFDRRKRPKHYCDSLAHDAFHRAVTEVHIAFYEKYFDRLDNAESHVQAAKSYIALDNLREAKKTIRRYMHYWEFREPYQVMPIELFTDPELWAIMSDPHFTESLLTIPHNRES